MSLATPAVAASGLGPRKLSVGAPPSRPPPEREPLPALRQDIELLPAPRERNGQPAWTIHDPVRGHFFRIGWLEFELLQRWAAISAEDLARRVKAETRLAVDAKAVLAFAAHLRDNQLLARPAGGQAENWKYFARIDAQGHEGPLKWLLHRYLFFRIPLVKPDRALATIEPRLRFLFSRGFFLCLAAALLLGLYLAGRQWDVLSARLVDLANFDTLPWFFAALAFTKVAHEFGHGLVGKHFGVRVKAAGVAFMVFWPMLYTDTTDAWRLTSRRARLAIDVAGMTAELVLAVLALLAWSFLPDGPVRDATLLIATVTWVMTLAVNLSPFMRFDGYFVLCDLVDMPNLQPRSFALAKWWIRRHVLGIAEPAPEPLPRARRHWMIAYAVSIWLYRLVLFTGIAILVYHFFIKLVGIALFAIEIGWFILLPVYRELKVWIAKRGRIRLVRGGIIAVLLVVLGVALLVTPWRARIEAPAVIRASAYTRLFPGVPGLVRTVDVHDGERVAAGAVLFTLASPDADANIAIAKAKIAENEKELELAAVNQAGAERIGIIREEIATHRREIAAQEDLKARLVVRSPIAGVISNVPSDLKPGRWAGDDTFLGVVADTSAWIVTAYVAEDDVERLKVGDTARFYGTSPDQPVVSARVTEIDAMNARTLDDKDLASPRGGPMAMQKAGEDRFRPVATVYRVRLEVDDAPATAALLQASRGTVQIDGQRRSLLDSAWRATAAVLIRESGF